MMSNIGKQAPNKQAFYYNINRKSEKSGRVNKTKYDVKNMGSKHLQSSVRGEF